MTRPIGRSARGRGGGRRAAGGKVAAPTAACEVVIGRIGAQGDGIADGARGPIYVPATVAGDRVRVRTVGARGAGHAAEVVELVAAGPGRAKPACRHFGRCGGCSLQHLDDGAYAAWKLARVSAALARAGVAATEVASLARTPPGGRRRAVFAAERPRAGGAARLGFNVRGTHTVVDIEECPILAPALFALVPALRALAGELLAPGGRTTLTATALAAGIDLVIDLPEPPGLAMRERLARFADDADLARLSWRSGAGGARSGAPEPIVIRRPPMAVWGGVPVVLPPGGFLQASEAGERALVAAVLAATEDAQRRGGGIADLFCGAGTFTLPLAAGGARVDAIDGDPAAIAALATAARRLLQVRCERRDLSARPLTTAELDRYDAVVFDPPRAGAAAQAGAIAASAVPVVVALSCNADTFARDARILAAGGYRLVRITPIDQFLWTPQIELAAVFRR